MLNEAVAMYQLCLRSGFVRSAALDTTAERADAWPMLYMACEGLEHSHTSERDLFAFCFSWFLLKGPPGVWG